MTADLALKYSAYLDAHKFVSVIEGLKFQAILLMKNRESSFEVVE